MLTSQHYNIPTIKRNKCNAQLEPAIDNNLTIKCQDNICNKIYVTKQCVVSSSPGSLHHIFFLSSFFPKSRPLQQQNYISLALRENVLQKGTKHHMTFQDLCNMSLTFYSGDHYLIMFLCAVVYLNNSSIVKSALNLCVQKKPMWPPSEDTTCNVHIIAAHCVSYVFITHSKWLLQQSLSFANVFPVLTKSDSQILQLGVNCFHFSISVITAWEASYHYIRPPLIFSRDICVWWYQARLSGTNQY